MKKYIQSITGILLLSTLFFFLNCSKSDHPTEVTSGTESTTAATVSDTLSTQEKSDLVHLREEEKLARDVYLYAYDKYGLPISKNISNSESTHMSRVLQLLTTYGLDDPADSETGIFNNEELQNLYDQLTADVDESVTKALIVGATIEDLDIKDIQDFIARTTNEDLLSMYENLMCGSRNHLRSYYAQILSYNASYTPLYITQDEFDSIINSSKEQCGQ